MKVQPYVVLPEGVTEWEVAIYRTLVNAGVPVIKVLKFLTIITEPNPERN